ncbi:MAG: MmgE/PrpD family protein [Chloroflexota bacterium]|nr:MmgE/PrpD family protein [Chloroflexota bacterium]
MTITETVSDFVVGTSYDDIPQEAVTAAKRAILDCLGCAVAGIPEPGSEIVRGYIADLGGRPEATVVGGGFKASAPETALANGTMAHALDYDDVAVSWVGHPSVAILPAILALGERERLSGRKALEGYVLGFEVGAKLGAAIGFGHYMWGWHATVTLGTMAAAAASARMLGLDAHGVRMALGLAASLAGGTRQNFGTMAKPFHAGSAARNGVVSALLAARGFTADEDILGGAMGFLKLFSGGAEYDPARVTAGLGQPFDLVSPGVSMKPYPCCRLTHRCIDAMLHIIDEHHPRAEDVESVVCLTSEANPQVLIHSRPRAALEGKFSMQYCMAIALIDGMVGLQQFTDEKVLDPRAQGLLSRVSFAHPQGLSGAEILGTPERVTVRLRDGTELSHEVLVAKGDPPNPMSDEEVAAKYRDCASSYLSTGDVQRSLELVSSLEEVEDVAVLMGLLA